MNDLVLQLRQKCAREFENFKQRLMQSESVETILEQAWAYSIIQNIVLVIDECDIDEKYVQALLVLDEPLRRVYDEYIETETESVPMQHIYECVTNAAKNGLGNAKEKGG